ncbi:hypothetical protein [Pleionea sp. CnH1-48]|uniref:hypothetical protein n=1 Tax=Pleionea sp. CnH1-48 TaxID=2954494 RepID=UPI0020972159|nr:hypothetical protein [Pleionea sp. CnH1-48]MCO7225063.1 hypothetical protein [Pleionea sp. CnH1-48]
MVFRIVFGIVLQLGCLPLFAQHYLMDCEGFCDDPKKKKEIVKRLWPDLFYAQSNVSHVIYFFNRQSDRLEYYDRLVAIFKMPTDGQYQDFIKGPIQGTKSQSDAAKSMLDGTAQLFEHFKLNMPPLISRKDLQSGYSVSGVSSLSLGFKVWQTLGMVAQVAEDTWLEGVSNTIVIWLSDSKGVGVFRTNAQLTNYSAKRTRYLNAQLGEVVSIISPEFLWDEKIKFKGNYSAYIPGGWKPAHIWLRLPDAYLALIWDAYLNVFKLASARDLNGNKLPLSESGLVEPTLVPLKLILSKDNIKLWKSMAKVLGRKAPQHLSVGVNMFETQKHQGVISVERQEKSIHVTTEPVLK